MGSTVDMASGLTAKLVGGDFAGVAAGFDEAVGSQLDAAGLETMWGQIIGQVGAYEETLRSEDVDSPEGISAAVVLVKFQNATLGVRWAFNDNGTVAGLNFTPA